MIRIVTAGGDFAAINAVGHIIPRKTHQSAESPLWKNPACTAAKPF